MVKMGMKYHHLFYLFLFYIKFLQLPDHIGNDVGHSPAEDGILAVSL